MIDRQPLIDGAKLETRSDVKLIDMPLITRYNIFIDNYNNPALRVNNTTLAPMPQSSVHNNTFQLLTDWKGKVLLF